MSAMGSTPFAPSPHTKNFQRYARRRIGRGIHWQDGGKDGAQRMALTVFDRDALGSQSHSGPCVRSDG